jgi:hypothetical protein
MGRVSSSSMRSNPTSTGSPIRTWAGSVPGMSAMTRTPSGSSASAMTSGRVFPGTGGWWCTT